MSDVYSAQSTADILAKEKVEYEPTAAEQRAEFLANRREARLGRIMEHAVFWGTIKAMVLMAIASALLWVLVLKLAPESALRP